jgi:hypothetical protein
LEKRRKGAGDITEDSRVLELRVLLEESAGIGILVRDKFSGELDHFWGSLFGEDLSQHSIKRSQIVGEFPGQTKGFGLDVQEGSHSLSDADGGEPV